MGKSEATRVEEEDRGASDEAVELGHGRGGQGQKGGAVVRAGRTRDGTERVGGTERQWGREAVRACSMIEPTVVLDGKRRCVEWTVGSRQRDPKIQRAVASAREASLCRMGNGSHRWMEAPCLANRWLPGPQPGSGFEPAARAPTHEKQGAGRLGPARGKELAVVDPSWVRRWGEVPKRDAERRADRAVRGPSGRPSRAPER